jgi:hypothetical protein
MSISIGRTRVYDEANSPLIIYTDNSNVLQLKCDYIDAFIDFADYYIGQQVREGIVNYTVFHSNVLLLNYNSNQMTNYIPSIFTQNVSVLQNLTVSSNIYVDKLFTSNISVEQLTGNLRISSNQQVIYEMGENGTFYVAGNIGVGVTNPSYQLEVRDTISAGISINTNNLNVNSITSDSNINSIILFTDDRIILDSDTVEINNIFLTGNTVFDDITILNGDIDKLFASNLVVVNRFLGQNAILIKQLNSESTFASTLNGNPIKIDSVFPADNTIPIFQVDTFGRICSGTTTATAPEADYAYTYYLQDSRKPYINGFMNLYKENSVEQTIINTNGFLSVGSNLAIHPIQVTNAYTGFESYAPNIKSIAGLYNITSNEVPYIRCYDCNQQVLFTINSNGALIFKEHTSFNQDYKIDLPDKGFIDYLHINKLHSDDSIDCTNTYLSNVYRLDACNLDIKNGVMSNVHIYDLSVNSISTNAFECIDDLNDYEEFRIHSGRFLFYGSNFVMNPNRFFFQEEQTNLPHDNFRIYANGGKTNDVNVIHTIANNRYSTVRVNNCNIDINSLAQLELEANQNRFSFGVINKSTTPGTQAEAFITNNIDLTNNNRQLTFTSTGCRIGTSIHLLQTGRGTFGNTDVGTKNLNVKGDVEVITNSGSTSFFINNTLPFVGIATSSPLYNLHVNGTMYVNSNNITSLFVNNKGNVGVGTNAVTHPFQVAVASTFDHNVNFNSNVTISGRLDTLGNVASTSDAQLKSQLKPIISPLEKIEKLTGYTYYRNDIHTYETGLIAQDVLKVLPEAVSQTENGLYTLAYGNLAGLFVEAIKELKKENESLKLQLQSILERS